MIESNPGCAAADAFSCYTLEFDAIKKLVSGYLSGPIGQGPITSLSPKTDLDLIVLALARVGEAQEFLRENSRPSLGGLEDPRSVLGKLHVEGITATALEMLTLLAVVAKAQELRKRFDPRFFPNLAALGEGLSDLSPLLGELDRKIHPDGSLDSSASRELGRIRRAIERLRKETQETLERLMRRFSRENVLQDAVVMVRNDRLVIPIRSEDKRHVPGVIHGVSSSGATVFLEPLDTVPLNNELVELEDLEYVETQRILKEFTAKLRLRLPELRTAATVLAEMDATFAKAEFARVYDCCLPQIASERRVVLKEVRHPLLVKALAKSGADVVPLTITLQEPKNLMVISGPNAGGKTVALKTLGVAVLMAQSGLPVAASEARLPLFRRVLADIGDQQSMQASLSTFSAHMSNIRAMFETVGPDDLVLLDEFGSSTEPGEGAALAIAILERFRRSRAMTFVTTHHGRLKAYASETSQAENAAMEFDEETLQPTYRLLAGLPGKSGALEIAARLGIPGEVVDHARSLIGSAEAEASAFLSALHDLKASYEDHWERLRAREEELQSRRAELEAQLRRDRAEKLKELDVRFETALRKIEMRWEAAVDELRAQLQAAHVRSNVGRKVAALREDAREEWRGQVLESLTGAASEPQQGQVPVTVGDRVRVPNLSSPGVVTAILDHGEIEVEVGRLRLRIAMEAASVAAPEPRGASTSLAMTAGRPAVKMAGEINVIGCTAEEALVRVDEYLDQAYVAGRFKVRLIHGHGKGILRRALHEMLASHPHVEKFYLSPQDQGGAGATIVELKT